MWRDPPVREEQGLSSYIALPSTLIEAAMLAVSNLKEERLLFANELLIIRCWYLAYRSFLFRSWDIREALLT